jgi:hypothetical protein
MLAALDPPVVTGALDGAYLRAALLRAGRPAEVELLGVERLTEGRINGGVSRLRTTAGSYVWKPVSRQSWIHRALGGGVGEAELWLAGGTRALPAPLSCPTVDVADHAEEDEWWILMDDVGAGIWPPSRFDEGKIGEFLEAIAGMHATWWGRDDELARLRIATLERGTGAVAAATLQVARGGEATGWVRDAVEQVWIVRTFVPLFLECLEPADADLYLEVCADRRPWMSRLEGLPRTLLHNDLRRANLSFLPDRISVFDWERACAGPAGVDLSWFWFLRFWAYPPADGKSLADRRPLLDAYLDRLAGALGARLDRDGFLRGFDLGFLCVLAQIGWLLADPLTSPGHTPDDVARVKHACRQAMAVARRALDAHVR